MAARQNLSPEQELRAKELYEEFWATYGTHIKNPSDINTIEKAHFLIEKGFEDIALMQKARKQKYPFTRYNELDPEDEGDSDMD